MIKDKALDNIIRIMKVYNINMNDIENKLIGQ